MRILKMETAEMKIQVQEKFRKGQFITGENVKKLIDNNKDHVKAELIERGVKGNIEYLTIKLIVNHK